MAGSLGENQGNSNTEPSASPRSGLDAQICVTFFPNKSAFSKKEEEGTLRELIPIIRETSGASKDVLPWLKLAVFGENRSGGTSLRNDDNVLAIHGIEGDYDGEQITVERARQIVTQAGLAALIYTSPSHTKAKPRWRILCPTSCAYTPSDRARLLARVNGLFVGALSDESWTLSQSYYYGFIAGRTDHQVAAIEGRSIDEAHELDAIAIYKAIKPKPGQPSQEFTPPRHDGDVSSYAKKALENECSNIVNAPDGAKHHALNKAAYSIGGLVGAGVLDRGHAVDSLCAALSAIRHRCADYAHAERTLRQAFEQGQAAPRTVELGGYGFDVESLGIFRAKAKAEQVESASAEDWESAFNTPLPETEQSKPAEVLWVDIGAWDAAAIPRRPWAVPNYLMRGSVTILSGQGAGGKSSLVVGWTLAMAMGTGMGDFVPPKPMVSINYNVEDDMDEQRRRYSAAIMAHGLTDAAFINRVIRCGPHDIGTLFERDDSGKLVATAALQQLAQLISESGAEVLICDPLAELHGEEENDNTAMRQVVAAFRTMARKMDIAVLILHHDRKGNSSPGDMDRMRGASSISGAVRVVVTLTTMSVEEAEEFGIPPDQRRRHFRVDGAKSNYALPTEAEWWRLTGYEIANGETVAAALPWRAPGMLDNVTMASCVAILEAIQRGYDGHPYGSGKNARKDIYAMMEGYPHALRRGQCEVLLDKWMEAGVLVEQHDCTAPNSRHKRSGFVVDAAKLQDMRANQ